MNEFRKRLYELLTKCAGVDPVLAEEILEDRFNHLLSGVRKDIEDDWLREKPKNCKTRALHNAIEYLEGTMFPENYLLKRLYKDLMSDRVLFLDELDGADKGSGPELSGPRGESGDIVFLDEARKNELNRIVHDLNDIRDRIVKLDPTAFPLVVETKPYNPLTNGPSGSIAEENSADRVYFID